MKETEVKIIEINKENVIKKLEEIGAGKVFEGDVDSTVFDFEDEKLANDKKFIRLRKKGDKSFLTLKKAVEKDKAKIMDEFETEIGDFNVMLKILKMLHLKTLKSYKKRRVSYKKDDVLFEIDEYPNIPALMEIEAPDIEIINKYVEFLEVDKDKVKNWDGEELLKNYAK